VSNINYLSINENFPIAGQDNDTQVFRDNFDTIKTSLRVANEEVTDLQDNVARTDDDNNFNLNTIQNAVMQNNRDRWWNGIGEGPYTASELNIEYSQGPYQSYNIGANLNIFFTELPGDPSLSGSRLDTVGKVTLELYSNNSSYNITFRTTEGTVLKCNGFPLAKIGDSQQPVALTADNASSPIIIEAWRYQSNEIFLRYIGQFN
jgi:hypothetical protein